MSVHHNPIGWGILDRPDSRASCGARLNTCGWTAALGSVTCKKCRAAAQQSAKVRGEA